MRGNAAFWVLTTLGLGAALGLPLVNVAPNRLVSGDGVSFWQVWQTLAAPTGVTEQAAHWPLWLFTITLLLLLALGLAVALRWVGDPPRWAGGLLLAGVCALMPGLLLLCGAYAAQVAVTQSAIARTSLGSAYWVLTLVLWLGLTHSLQQLRAGLVPRSAVWLGLILSMAGLLAWGECGQLSLMKEFANHADTFADSVLRHLQIVLFTLAPTLCLGLPLGWAVHHSARLRQWLLPPLNIIQTIPSIALFGLLMVPLAWLAGAWPWLAHWGVNGIGLAQVPTSVLDAARGMGMQTAQILWWVQLPLAAPVILAGVRTAAIQTVGLAAVAALIGAGGLGAIMFDGLFGSAQDLVLLGVLPIVGLALLLDLGFKGLAEWLRPVPNGALA
jgi:osmoprotectant transport system permease protein